MSLTLRERYELARDEHRAWLRRLDLAQRGESPVQLPASERLLERLRHEVAEALKVRQRAFEAFMNSDEDQSEGHGF